MHPERSRSVFCGGTLGVDCRYWNVEVTVNVNWGWFSLSPSRQRPQTGPFAIPRFYPYLDISLIKNLRDFRINLARSLTLILFMSSGSIKLVFAQMLILAVT